jgi:hypothetical protein
MILSSTKHIFFPFTFERPVSGWIYCRCSAHDRPSLKVRQNSPFLFITVCPPNSCAEWALMLVTYILCTLIAVLACDISRRLALEWDTYLILLSARQAACATASGSDGSDPSQIKQRHKRKFQSKFPLTIQYIIPKLLVYQPREFRKRRKIIIKQQ